MRLSSKAKVAICGVGTVSCFAFAGWVLLTRAPGLWTAILGVDWVIAHVFALLSGRWGAR